MKRNNELFIGERARRGWSLSLVLCMTWPAACTSEGDTGIERPVLRICTDPECIEAAPSDDPCDSLDKIGPGQGFYAVHGLPAEIELDDATKGTLALATACGESTFELVYESGAAEGIDRLAVVPVLAPSDVRCGFTVRATLLDQTDICVRPIDGSADECAALRDACSPSDEESSADGGSSSGEAETMSDEVGGAEPATGTTSGGGTDMSTGDESEASSSSGS